MATSARPLATFRFSLACIALVSGASRGGEAIAQAAPNEPPALTEPAPQPPPPADAPPATEPPPPAAPTEPPPPDPGPTPVEPGAQPTTAETPPAPAPSAVPEAPIAADPPVPLPAPVPEPPAPPSVLAPAPADLVAASAPPPLGRPVEAQALAETSTSRRLRRFGVALDAGMSGMLPDVGVMFVYRPLGWLRSAAGIGHNLVRPGIQASLSLVSPILFPVSLTGEAGHFFEGNVNDAIQRIAGKQSDLAVLERVSYQFANALVGVEIGSRRMTFYLRAGFTTMRMSLKNFDQVVKKAIKDERAHSSDPRLSYRGPTAKLGLVVYF